MLKRLFLLFSGLLLFFSAGCAALETFPLAARAGDTVSLFLGVGNFKQMSTDTSTVEMYPVSDPATKYYPTLRSIFYVYPDPTSKVVNYPPSTMLNGITSGDNYQAIAVIDLPANVPPGRYKVAVDGSSVDLEVLSGVGRSHDFTDIFNVPEDIRNLEPAPQVNIAFDGGFQIGAVELVVDYDETVIAPADLNVVLFPVNQGAGTFGDFQDMLFWREKNGTLKISVLCPAGVPSEDIHLAIVYPAGVSNPGISLISSSVLDLGGNVLSGVPVYLN